MSILSIILGVLLIIGGVCCMFTRSEEHTSELQSR